MRKRIITLILFFTLVLSMSVSAIEPRMLSVTPSLTFDGTTATCMVSVIDTGKEIEVTLELWCGNDFIDSWSDSGKSRVIISEECKVTKGNTYTLKVSGKVDGKAFTGQPISGKC